MNPAALTRGDLSHEAADRTRWSLSCRLCPIKPVNGTGVVCNNSGPSSSGRQWDRSAGVCSLVLAAVRLSWGTGGCWLSRGCLARRHGRVWTAVLCCSHKSTFRPGQWRAGRLACLLSLCAPSLSLSLSRVHCVDRLALAICCQLVRTRSQICPPLSASPS